jgi:hypothetical protein
MRKERKVAMVVALFPVENAQPKLEPAALEELAKLGVTSLALLRDSCVAGVVLEGWAFDLRDAQRAVRAVAGASDGVRTLQPLVQMGVSSAARNDYDQKGR